MSKEIMAVKQQVRLENWAAEVESCAASGLTVQQWCRDNGMSPKTYYYHLRKVRESVIESEPVIVPLNNKVASSEKIEISDGEINIALPADMNIEALSAVIRVLKNAQ